MEEITKTIDIEKAIRSSNSAFLKSLPKFVIRLITKIVGQEEINLAIYNNRSKIGVPFLIAVLKEWNVKVEVFGAENIPASGRFIFVSNHPVGGMDALSAYHVIYRYYSDIVSPANEILKIIPNLHPLIFSVNVFGKTSKERALKLNELYESDTQIFTFPAGEVSRRKKGVISDIEWQKSFITKAIQYNRDVIPVFISGRNSNLFYFIANLRKFLGIKMYIETILLPREMLRQRNSTVTVYIGKPIISAEFTEEISHYEWAQKVKENVYSLPLLKQ